MSCLRIMERTAADWKVQLPVPGVLRQAGAVGPSGPRTGCGTDRSYRAAGWKPWAGRDLGVRAPEPGETALSRGEVQFALQAGLLDHHPLARQINGRIAELDGAALSQAEVLHAFRSGLLDDAPPVQIYRPAGTWERPGKFWGTSKPTPWEGLE